MSAFKFELYRWMRMIRQKFRKYQIKENSLQMSVKGVRELTCLKEKLYNQEQTKERKERNQV